MLLLGVLGALTSRAQLGQPQGQFLTDTVEVGKPFWYALSFRHRPDQEVFFPDTTYHFAPFEVLEQDYFLTRTDSSGSLDSTIYKLVIFEVAPLQPFTLPVFLLAENDCTQVLAPVDTVFVRRMAGVAEADSLRREVAVLPLRRQFNYSIFFGVVGVLGTLSFGIYWLFGRSIARQWQVFLLQRRHSDFLRNFNRLNRSTRESGRTSEAEKAVIVWKKYLERLEQKPFATYTTREIVDNIPDEALEKALRDIDGIIYGQGKSKNIEMSLQVLRSVALRAYRQRRREITMIDKTGV
ncbi:hypothetical protein GCM10027275_05800 [Rhabdobacter roseus]